jgi:hypothetical protein
MDADQRHAQPKHESAIAKGARTADIAAAGMRTMSTREMGDAVYAELATN